MDRIHCQRCGTCCKEPILPINDEDARQIAQASGMAVRDFVTFIRFEDVDWPENEDDWVYLRQGRRLLTMGKTEGRCIFLTDRGCAIYKSRPRACRMFPLDFSYYEDGEVFEIEEQNRVECKAETPDFLDDSHPLARMGWDNYRADFVYRIRVECWNRLRPDGTEEEFLRFLNLDPESLSQSR